MEVRVLSRAQVKKAGGQPAFSYTGGMEPIRKFWYAENPIITAFFNGLSVSIPEIERFIVGSVRDTYPRIKDKQLETSVHILAHEEEAHARVHDAYNAMLQKQGYQIKKFEAIEHRIAQFFNKRSIKTRLAVCVCSEFYTAVMSRHVLESRAVEKPGVDERMRALWTWHALEELHHRSTAFDLYLDQGGGYFRRCGLMLFMTLRWLFAHVFASLAILRQSKAKITLSTFWHGAGFITGYHGFYTNIIPSWFAFFKPGFHPRKDIELEHGLDPDLRHFHVEKHFVEVVEGMSP